MDDKKINSLDVFKYYEEKIKDSVSKNTNEYIDNLFNKSNYNKKIINELSPKVANQQKQINAYNKKFFNKPTFFKNIRLVITLFALLSIGGIVLTIWSYKDPLPKSWLYAGISLLSAFGVLFLIFVIFYFKWKKQSKLSKEAIDPIIKQNKDDVLKMTNEMLKVTSLIKARDCFDIYEKSFPGFVINNHISHDDYGLWNDILAFNDEESLYCEIHGNVYNHSYMYLTKKLFKMCNVPYTGSTVVMVTRRDSDGHYHTVPETVTATIMKPKPFFSKESNFVYKVGVYPELTFSNLPSFSNNHQVKRFYKKHKDYSIMENPKFDMLLPCIRNNDLQFHTVFSIFTQQQIVSCFNEYKLKNLKFNKQGLYIYTNIDNNLTNKRLVYHGDVFLDYSPDIVRENFVNSMNNNMKYLYQYMSPIFAISLFQQEHFNIPSRKLKNNNAFACMIQKIINTNANIEKYFNQFTSDIVYDGIPKAKTLYETGKYSVSELVVNSFSHTPKVEYVTKYVEGKIVSVPVHYNEYNEINAKYLSLSWINNKNMKDFVIENKNEYMINNKIKGIYKYLDQVLVVFDSSLNSIKGNENTIISTVNKLLI